MKFSLFKAGIATILLSNISFTNAIDQNQSQWNKSELLFTIGIITIICLFVLILISFFCADNRDDDDLYEESTDDDSQRSAKGGILYDEEGNRRAFQYMCHHCGKILDADLTCWAPIGGFRVRPWRASVEHVDTGKTYFIQEISHKGVNSVSCCPDCNLLSNDEVKYEPPAEALRYAQETQRRYEKTRRSESGSGKKRSKKGRSQETEQRLHERSGYASGAILQDTNSQSSNDVDNIKRQYLQNNNNDNNHSQTTSSSNANLTEYGVVTFSDNDSVPAPQSEYGVVTHLTEPIHDDNHSTPQYNTKYGNVNFKEVSRKEAESEMLTAPPGSYIVRPSSKQGCLSLTFYDVEEGSVKNMLLINKNNEWTCDDYEFTFKTVEELKTHLLIGYFFNEPAINFRAIDRRAAEAVLSAFSIESGAYVVRPAGNGALCLSCRTDSGNFVHILLYHTPDGYKFDGDQIGVIYPTMTDAITSLTKLHPNYSIDINCNLE